MSAKEVKRRRGTKTQNDAFTGADGEITINSTNKRVRVHDAITAGGYECPNINDVQNQAAVMGTVGGSANAITLTNDPACVSLTNLRVRFKATADNTSATTVTVDSLTTKNIYKFTGSSAVVLTGGEIKTGCIYELNYDGTQFQLGLGGVASGGADQQTFNSSGTWNKPSSLSPDSPVLIEGWGAGGGASDSGAGAGQNGASGGASSFGSHLTAYGGSGGYYQTTGGNAGGWFSTAAVNINVSNDTPGEGWSAQASPGSPVRNAGNGYYIGGGGAVSSKPAGSSVYGGGGGAAAFGGSAGSSTYGGAGGANSTNGTAPGGGGGGASTGSSTGGGGGSYKYCWKKLSDLGSTETVTVGSGGAGGGNGASGAVGRIKVTVFG